MEPTPAQRRQLEALGRHGKTLWQMQEMFGDDLDERIIANGWVRVHRLELEGTRIPGEPPPPPIASYHLTPKGAELVGVDPQTLPSF
jgi:hypothetical protein